MRLELSLGMQSGVLSCEDLAILLGGRLHLVFTYELDDPIRKPFCTQTSENNFAGGEKLSFFATLLLSSRVYPDVGTIGFPLVQRHKICPDG